MGVDDKDKGMNKTDFECCHCNRQLKNEEELLEHVKDTHVSLKELLKCKICGKHFGNEKYLQLHLQVHKANDKEGCTQPSSSGAPHIESRTDGAITVGNRLELKSSPTAKKVGLTKIRLEDCLRCDACSCIYLDDSDYHKHMRNCHREETKRRRQKRQCRSCCKHCNCDGDHQARSKTSASTNHLHFNIKDRWRKIVSTRLDCEKMASTIKDEPDAPIPDDAEDYSHLLSQVEVRIKTEPQDDIDYTGPLEV